MAKSQNSKDNKHCANSNNNQIPPKGFSNNVRNKLAETGISIFPETEVSQYLIYRSPCIIKPNSRISCSTIDSYSQIGCNCSVTTTSIGRYVSIADNVRIGLGLHDIKSASTSISFYNNRYFLLESGPICEIPNFIKKRGELFTNRVTIGHDVWIGDSVIFTDDVSVGHGSVIGAGTIVTKDIPPYSIVVNRNGHGEVIKQRFSDEIVSDLMSLNWWDYDLPSLVSAQEVVYHKLHQDPLYDENCLQFLYAQKLNEKSRAEFDSNLVTQALTKLYQHYGIEEVTEQSLLELKIPYQDPKAFIQFLKSHDLSKFPKLTDKNFLRLTPIDPDNAMVDIETP